MRTRFLIPALACGLLVLASLSQPGAVEWERDLDAALVRASESDRLLLVHFTTDGRPLAQEMWSTTFAERAVMAASRPFVSVALDASAHAPDYERWVGGRGALATCVVAPDGEAVSALVGFAEARELAPFLDRAADLYPRWTAARAAVRANPDDASAWLDWAHIALDLGTLDLARERFEHALGLGNLAVRVASLEELARLAAESGDAALARERLAELRRTDPSSSTVREDHVLLSNALALHVERRSEEALPILRALAASDSESDDTPRAHLALGSVLCAVGEAREAREVLEQLAERHAGDHWALEAERLIEHVRSPECASGHPIDP